MISFDNGTYGINNFGTSSLAAIRNNYLLVAIFAAVSQPEG